MTFRREDLAEWVTLYCGDCRDVLPTLGLARPDLFIASPNLIERQEALL